MPKFSVIVPVYNVKEYLPECIDSLVGQSYRDYEVLLIDDGSTDESGELCEKYASEFPKIKCFHKENGGLSDARNYGIARAEGEYLCFVDSDDYVGTDMLQAYVDVINNQHCAEESKNKSIDVILEPGQHTIKTSKNGKISIEHHLKFKGGEAFGYISGPEAFSICMDNPSFAAFGKCFRRQFWIGNQFEFTKGLTAEDLDLIYKVVYKATKVAMTSDYYYYYRDKREGSIMSTFGYKNIMDLFHIFEGWEQFFRDKNVDSKDADKMRKLFGENLVSVILPACWNIYKANKDASSELEQSYDIIRNYLIYRSQLLAVADKLVGYRYVSMLCYIRKYIIQKFFAY